VEGGIGNAECGIKRRWGDEGCGRFTEKNKHPPAMHSPRGWCKHGRVNQMVKIAPHRFQGIVGRSNVQH
jgi:hypothetical protein